MASVVSKAAIKAYNDQFSAKLEQIGEPYKTMLFQMREDHITKFILLKGKLTQGIYTIEYLRNAIEAQFDDLYPECTCREDQDVVCPVCFRQRQAEELPY